MTDQKPDNPILTNMVTLRDYFAGQALAGQTLEMHLSSNPRILAEYCYKLANAMLIEREAK